MRLEGTIRWSSSKLTARLNLLSGAMRASFVRQEDYLGILFGFSTSKYATEVPAALI